MTCPFCNGRKDRVVDSRESRDGRVIRRRRECTSCSRRFTSYEQVEEVRLMVVKRDDRREAFDRAKLLAGVEQACQKRPIPTQQLEEVISEVENSIRDRSDREIAAEEIGQMVMEKLKPLDQVAYVRFASVYRRFEDADEFMKELRSLLGPGAGDGA